LQLRDLVEMNFRELFMKTADNHDIIFYHWVWIRMFVADILRDIRCFVVSKITQIIAVEQIEHLSLILRLSWLYFVNAFISIRKFKIIIDDVNIDEIVREMIDFELVFCKNHNLLMYSKFVMTSFSEKNSIVKNVFDSFDFDSFSDDLSDVNDSSDANF
jgi:sulfite reductase beta subunit-like hemoprotein